MQTGPIASFPPRAQAPVVRDRPYVAVFTCHDRESGKIVVSGQMFRDSEGRSRIDYDLGGPPMRIIDDAVKSSISFVFMQERAFQTEKYHQKPTDWAFRSVIPTHTGEIAQITGIQCERVSFRHFPEGGVSNSDAGEAWISKDHGIVMKETAPHEGWVWEITMLEHREPAAGTFDVPAGFVNMGNN
jgi:hypothetical protein